MGRSGMERFTVSSHGIRYALLMELLYG
jgi:hypothetical protein